jgi:hypothetical protein
MHSRLRGMPITAELASLRGTKALACGVPRQGEAMQAAVPMELSQQRKQAFVDELKRMPIALHTDKANEQHYEVCHGADTRNGDASCAWLQEQCVDQRQ